MERFLSHYLGAKRNYPWLAVVSFLHVFAYLTTDVIQDWLARRWHGIFWSHSIWVYSIWYCTSYFALNGELSGLALPFNNLDHRRYAIIHGLRTVGGGTPIFWSLVILTWRLVCWIPSSRFGQSVSKPLIELMSDTPGRSDVMSDTLERSDVTCPAFYPTSTTSRDVCSSLPKLSLFMPQPVCPMLPLLCEEKLLKFRCLLWPVTGSAPLSFLFDWE